MDDLVWKIVPLITGGIGYIGGILTDPLKKVVTDRMRLREIRAGMIGEIANAYEQYHFALGFPNQPDMLTSVITSLRVDCYQNAKTNNPFLLHRIDGYFYLSTSLDFAASIKAKKPPYGDYPGLLQSLALQCFNIETWLRELSRKDQNTFSHALGKGARARVKDVLSLSKEEFNKFKEQVVIAEMKKQAPTLPLPPTAPQTPTLPPG